MIHGRGTSWVTLFGVIKKNGCVLREDLVPVCWPVGT